MLQYSRLIKPMTGMKPNWNVNRTASRTGTKGVCIAITKITVTIMDSTITVITIITAITIMAIETDTITFGIIGHLSGTEPATGGSGFNRPRIYSSYISIIN
jgi:hypothetical protein